MSRFRTQCPIVLHAYYERNCHAVSVLDWESRIQTDATQSVPPDALLGLHLGHCLRTKRACVCSANERATPTLNSVTSERANELHQQ